MDLAGVRNLTRQGHFACQKAYEPTGPGKIADKAFTSEAPYPVQTLRTFFPVSQLPLPARAQSYNYQMQRGGICTDLHSILPWSIVIFISSLNSYILCWVVKENRS